MPDPTEFLRLALDPVRLSVLGRAVTGPLDCDALAAELDVPARRVLEAAARLREAGLLDPDLRLDRVALRRVAQQLPSQPPAADTIAGEGWTAPEQEVLARFFSGSRLTSIPSQHAKRLVILERLAQEFEPGVRYPERQVDFTLQLFHADYAALRRYLVDEGFLTRADGVYWRTGGRFDAHPGAAR